MLTEKMISDLASGIGIKESQLWETLKKIKHPIKENDLKKLTSMGIPIFEEISKNKKIKLPEILALAQTGKLEYKDLEKALKDLCRGRFYRMAENKPGYVQNIKLFCAVINEKLKRR